MGCCESRTKIGGKRTLGVSNVKAAQAVNRMKENNAKIEKFVMDIIAKGQPWTDPDFPPELRSLYDPNLDEGDINKYKSFQWKRFKELAQSPAMFKDGIDPNDINQGQLGDCYFLAVLSSLAEFPDRVNALFVTKELNAAGIYLVKFFINGNETPVIVDDYLPCTKNGSLAFASSRDEEMWVSVLEKAWAKLHGTYARTEGGLPCFACSHLVGVPSESFSHDDIEDQEEFWDLLQSADNRNFTMMAASHGQGEERSSEGVISGHAYSLISINEFQHNGEEVKLLKLRNPWGSGEWQGDWSDKSELWTPELRKKLGCFEDDDGAFFIRFDDYLQHFSWSSICVENNIAKYAHSSLYHSFGSKDTSPLPQAFFSFELKNEVDFSKYAFAVSCQQQGNRLAMYRQKDPKALFKPTNINIVLATENGEFINARFGNKFMFSLLNQKITLKPGKYVVMVDPVWNDEADNDDSYREMLVDIYAPEQVELKQVEDGVGMQIIAKAFANAAQTKIPEEARDHYLEENADYGDSVYRVTDVEALDCWYGFIYTRNQSPYRLKETLKPQLKGLEVQYPKMDGQDIDLDIPAGGDSIIVLRRIDNSCSYGLAYMTHPRELSDAELVEEAKNLDGQTEFGETLAWFKLYNTARAAVFYFENHDKETLTATFELEMENLAIQGEAQDATSFSVRVTPGGTTHKILKPILENDGTSIQMRYSFDFE